MVRNIFEKENNPTRYEKFIFQEICLSRSERNFFDRMPIPSEKKLRF